MCCPILRTLDSPKRLCFLSKMFFLSWVASDLRLRTSVEASPAMLLAVVTGLVSESYRKNMLVVNWDLIVHHVGLSIPYSQGYSERSWKKLAPSCLSSGSSGYLLQLDAPLAAPRQEYLVILTVGASTGIDGMLSSIASVIGVSVSVGESFRAGAILAFQRAHSASCQVRGTSTSKFDR